MPRSKQATLSSSVEKVSDIPRRRARRSSWVTCVDESLVMAMPPFESAIPLSMRIGFEGNIPPGQPRRFPANGNAPAQCGTQIVCAARRFRLYQTDLLLSSPWRKAWDKMPVITGNIQAVLPHVRQVATQVARETSTWDSICERHCWADCSYTLGVGYEALFTANTVISSNWSAPSTNSANCVRMLSSRIAGVV